MLAQEHAVYRFLAGALVDAAPGRRVALRIQVDQQCAAAIVREARGEIHRDRCLAYAALLVRDHEDAHCHAASTKTRCRFASSFGTCSSSTRATRCVTGTRPISSKGYTPFIARSRPPGATRWHACVTKSPRSEKARETTASNFAAGCHCSTRSQTTVTLSSASSVFACCRKAHFLWLESSSVTRASGRAIAIGIPGRPAPEPTSTMLCAPSRYGSTARLSRRCSTTSCSRARTAVRLWTRFHFAMSS